MDQSQKNLERIRAYDADEGEWRTINGAHVLVKNGRIAGGAGGALNGQRFQGHSVGKMAAGSKGQTFKENKPSYSKMRAKGEHGVPQPAGMNRSRLKYASKIDKNKKYTVVAPHSGRADHGNTNSDPQFFDVLRGAKVKSQGNYATTFASGGKEISIPNDVQSRYSTERPYEEPTKKGLQARINKLKQSRPELFKQGRQDTQTTHRGFTQEELRQLKAAGLRPVGKVISYERNPEEDWSTESQIEHLRMRRDELSPSDPGYRNLSKRIYKLEASLASSRAQPPVQSTPRQSKLGRMQPGSTAVNANKETKRLGNNARVYKRTARLQREKKKASTGAKIQELQRKMDLAQQAYNEAPPLQKYKYEGQVTALNNQYRQLKSDLAGYYAQSIAKEDDRNQDAANAKSHLAKMQKLAKALKQSRPDLFKSGNRSGSSPAPAKQHKVGRLPQGKSGYNLSAKYNKANEEGLSAIRKGEREIDQRHKEMMTALRSPYAEFGPHDPSVYRDFVINNFKDYANEKRRKMAEAEKPAMKLAMRLSPAEERIRKLKSRRPDLFKRK